MPNLKICFALFLFYFPVTPAGLPRLSSLSVSPSEPSARFRRQWPAYHAVTSKLPAAHRVRLGCQWWALAGFLAINAVVCNNTYKNICPFVAAPQSAGPRRIGK